MEDEYCAKHRSYPVINSRRVPCSNFYPFPTAFGSGKYSFHLYNMSSNEEEDYLMPKYVAE
jgi:hypothetical protein